MIKPASGSWVGYKQKDWYSVDFETAKPLFYQSPSGNMVAIPGVRNWMPRATPSGNEWPKEVIVHRTHLPLLTSPEALALLTNVRASDWEARNRATAALGYQLRVTQHQAVDFIDVHRGTLLADDMRLGKGHPVGTKILTPEGWQRIEHLQVGSYVVGSNGQPCRVTGLYDRGVLPVFKVTFSDKTSIYVDGDHLWHAWDHNAWHRGGNAKVIETRALIDDLCYANGNRKWRIPLVRPIAFPTRNLPIDAYVLGVLLGDGSLSHGTVSFTPGDDLVPEEVRRRLPSDVELRSSAIKGKATCWRISARDTKHNSVLQALRELGLQGEKSPDKFVPDVYLFSSVEQRIDLLQGLMDTDGEWCDGILAFSSSSARLRDAVQFLVESLGGSARATVREKPVYTYKGEQREGLPSYRLTIALPEGIAPFKTRAGYKPRNKFKPTRHIASIEPGGHVAVFCISVDAPDQLYVTEHCIVTHNTLTCVQSHDPARGPFVVVAPLSTRAVWLGWMRRVFPDLPIGVLTGKKKIEIEKLRCPLVFCHYDILKFWQTAMLIGTLVFDEGHALCNRDSDRARAASIIASRAEKIIIATGTPVWDMPPDLWNLIGMLAPAAWGGYYDFGYRYGDPHHNGYGVEFRGATNVDELSARLSEVKIRRLWRDVRSDLPPISRNIVVADVDETTSRRLDILAAKMKKDRTNAAASLAHYRSQLCKVKLKPVVREAVKLMEGGQPVVVWAWHREFAEQIHEALKLKSWLIHGEVPADERERRMEMWRRNLMYPQAVEQPLALVATMAVAQVGIDLSHSHLPIFAELDWTPAVIAQTEMRTYSPDRPMNATFVIANHFVEQRVVRALVSKLDAADPLGFGAAVDAIDALRAAFEGPQEEPDMDRFLDDILASGIESVR